MKKTGIGLTMTLLLLGAYMLIKPATPVKEGVFQGLPWHIQVLEDARSEVFGLTLEGSTLDQVDAALGEDRTLAVLMGDDQTPRLEMYHQKFSAGPIQGRLILSFQADPQALMALIKQRPVSEYTRSGSKKYVLGPQATQAMQASVLQQMIFIPTINLDADTIQDRFGPADRTEQPEPLTTRFLYPAQGLDIVVHDESKEVIRYVAPRSWAH